MNILCTLHISVSGYGTNQISFLYKDHICMYLLPRASNKVTKKLRVKSIGLVSLFNGISTLFRLFNAKAIFLEEQ